VLPPVARPFAAPLGPRIRLGTLVAARSAEEETVVYVPPRRELEPLPEPDEVPAVGPNPAIRRAWSRFEEKELRWWLAVVVLAVLFSFVAYYAAR